jgi:hypothetical protein
VPQLASVTQSPRHFSHVNVVSQVNSIFTNDVPARLRASQEGQAIAEYAMLLAAIIGLLAFVSGFGLVTGRVLTWIANNLTF